MVHLCVEKADCLVWTDVFGFKFRSLQTPTHPDVGGFLGIFLNISMC